MKTVRNVLQPIMHFPQANAYLIIVLIAKTAIQELTSAETALLPSSSITVDVLNFALMATMEIAQLALAINAWKTVIYASIPPIAPNVQIAISLSKALFLVKTKAMLNSGRLEIYQDLLQILLK